MTEITLETALDRRMRIEKARPPNFDAIAAVLPGALGKNVIFCYGDTIFNPSGQLIPLALLAHEAVHSIQQERIGVKVWWNAYLDAPWWRFEEELRAHQIEVQQACAEMSGRNFRRRYTAAVAERLSGPLYGRAVSKAKALELLKEKV